MLTALAIAACGEPNAPGSPADADIRKALVRFYAQPHGPLEQFSPNYMKFHNVVAAGPCKAQGPDFVCSVTFQRTGEGEVRRFVWMTNETGDWNVGIILAEIPPEPILDLDSH